MLSQLYKSPIQSHIWLKLNPHSYLFTFWAWSNIVAFREMSWSSSTLVIYHAHSSIKSIKSGSSEALHPPEKKEKKWNASEETLLLEQQKKGQRGRMEEPRSNTTQKDIHPSHTCTWPSSKVTWPLKDKIFSYLKLHKSLSKSRRGFSNYLSEIQIQKRD